MEPDDAIQRGRRTLASSLTASAALLGSLWLLAPQRIETQQTTASSSGSGVASEVARSEGVSAAADLFLARAISDPSLAALSGSVPADWEQTLEFLRELLATMSDREIIDAVVRLTELEAEDFDSIRDVRGHVLRLAEIAVGKEHLGGDGVAPVIFARSVDPGGQNVLEDSAFHDRNRAIYAVFPTTPRSDAVYVKWQRSDAAEPLHLGRHPIDTARDRNHVWLEPADGWGPGTYRVEVYTADAEVTPLAVGRFEIVPVARFASGNHSRGKGIPLAEAAQ